MARADKTSTIDPRKKDALEISSSRAIPLRSPLGMAIERLRREKGIGLNELAKMAKIDAAQLSRLERGHQVTAHASTLRKVANALGTEVNEFMRLREVSLKHQWTTEDIDAVRRRAYSDTIKVEEAILRDASIPEDKKDWLLNCVALVRESKR